MNEYTFEQLEVGMTETFSVLVSSDMLQKFMEISGDNNPMHMDDEYAKSKGFQNRIVYGMLTAAYYSTLVGVYLPGKYCIFQESHVSFTKPVYIDDTLTITGTIKEIDSVLRRVTIKAYIRNHRGDKVSRATLIVGVMDNGR